MPDKEIKEAKSLRWLANQFPKVENPKDNGDRLCNCINLYCTNAAEFIERQAAEIRRLSTLAELGNTRASDYRVVRDRALKVEAENERLKKDSKDIDEFARNICKERLLQGKAIADFDSLRKYIKMQKTEAYKEVLGIIDQVYNKHIFDSNDLTDEEKDAIINFYDDITDKLRKLKEEMAGE